ncbi:MAG: DUF3307 domain-containing protein [Porphyromonadaceae bacterium]|nr:DUF3307 domain-containing protein [Porphyromonadaceae bacterium]
MEKIILAQFIAHVVADFFAQPDSICRGKQEKGFGSWHIYVHVLIVFVASFLMTFAVVFILYAVAIMIIHFTIDILKSFIERWLKRKKGDIDKFYANHYLFFTDQLLHVATIYGVVAIYWIKNPSIPAYLDVLTISQLLILTGTLVCMKPANVIIRNCLSSLNLYDQVENMNDLNRAGRWIGTIERIMAMVLVMLQQYTAIGFIITAKSVLRYNESKTGKTEYVLIGTLLSFSIALLVGIGISEGLLESFLKLISC